jgi:hypothetical protein
VPWIGTVIGAIVLSLSESALKQIRTITFSNEDRRLGIRTRPHWNVRGGGGRDAGFGICGKLSRPLEIVTDRPPSEASYAPFSVSRSRACCASLTHAWAISNNLALLPGCSAARASRRQSTTCA